MKVDKFIFLVIFVILDLDDRIEAPLVLGRSFLAALQALINVNDKRTILRVGEKEVVYKLQVAVRHSMDFDDSCYFVDHVDEFVDKFIQDSLLKEELERTYLKNNHPRILVKKRQRLSTMGRCLLRRKVVEEDGP